MHYEDVKIKSGDMISKFIENGSESSGGQASTHCCEVAPIANGRLIGNRLKKKPWNRSARRCITLNHTRPKKVN